MKDFDIVGFTLQYEMSYTNILEMLHLGGIPVKSAERSQNDPIVVAGGPCAFNPEPLHQFVDAFMIGDGEDVIIQLTDIIKECRKNFLIIGIETLCNQVLAQLLNAILKLLANKAQEH